ncbi:MAG: hypothetical protein JSV09_17025, partial [Thermoplasmata archaeon]
MPRKKKSLSKRISDAFVLVVFLATLIFTSSLVLGSMTPVAEKYERESQIKNPTFIRLSQYTFNPLHESSDIPPSLELHQSQGYYIIQLFGPIHQEMRWTLENLGVNILSYIPEYAYLVKMSYEIRKKVESLTEIRWIGLYHPAYKIQSDLIHGIGEIELNVLVFRDNERNLLEVRNRLRELGGSITYDGEDNYIIRTKIDASKIRDMAFTPEVEWIDEYKPPVPEMNNIRGYTGTNLVHLDGFKGSGIVGEVKDNGIDMSHPDFVGQIIATDGPIYDRAHGTCTFGIVFSTGANNADAMGMLPEGKGAFCEYMESRYTSVEN